MTWELCLFICGTPRQMEYYPLPQDASCSKGSLFDKWTLHKVGMKAAPLFPEDTLPYQGLMGRGQAMIRKSITAEETRSEQCSLSTKKEQEVKKKQAEGWAKQTL